MVQTTGAALEQRWNNRIPLSIRDKRVEHWFRELWENKTEMCNFALARITEPCVLMQIDADEIWRADQLEKIVSLFDVYPSLAAIKFACRYFVGPKLRAKPTILASHV